MKLKTNVKHMKLSGLGTLSILAIGLINPSQAALVMSTGSGDYYTGATWGGTAPDVNGGDDVVIGVGHDITATAVGAPANTPDVSVGNLRSGSPGAGTAGTLTVNGSLTGDNEFQMGFRATSASSSTLVIGSTGSVSFLKAWISISDDTGSSSLINFVGVGGSLTFTGGFGGGTNDGAGTVRLYDSFGDGGNDGTLGTGADETINSLIAGGNLGDVNDWASATYEDLWNIGLLQRNGANSGTFTDNFVVNGGTLTAVPEPSSVALLGLGGLALIMRRRK
ncbi:hypothetical protein NT6N_02200 [Oceaniferula spumae]|uniref:Ice-binding protein C-terminal domain-containing protein n=1 Tax=Oceaniferula spumae TaxID=2979115 RepID=A0AAT9FGT1_9BACT